MTTLQAPMRGLAASPGVARGRWRRVARLPLPPAGRVAADAVDAEVARLHEAARAASADLRRLATSVRDQGHPDEAAIFQAHAAIARDPAIIEAAAAAIRTSQVDAAGAIVDAARAASAQLAALPDELLRGRATDVLDVGDRIARMLAGLPADDDLLPVPAIVVAEDLTPSLTATLPRDRIRGIALEGSSPTAHAAILARAYGIPAVVGIRGLLAGLRAAGEDAELAIDGTSGVVVIAPDERERRRFDLLAAAARAGRERDLAEATLPAMTVDGTEVTLLANIGTPDEAGPAAALGARGVGLFRTEFLFLERATPPSEDEQADAYRTAVEAFGGDPVTVRLLDVGGDKPIPYLPISAEDNPFLGVRALRLAEQRPDLFVTQLRACYRAAVAGPIKVMAPMVADARDVERLTDLAAEARAGLAGDGIAFGEIALGVMLEIPSAVLVADTYFGSLRFASLGTNDLLQYTLAVDRGNPALERYRDSLHPAVLRLIRLSVEAARRAGIELSVCGEMAGDPVAALALVGVGVRQLSMAAPSLPAVRRAIRGADLAALQAAANAALSDGSATVVRIRFEAIRPA
ncbi:MAG: phosphoenolpyruvate--protein phosphotransferase [Chloroflexota bacterium]